MTARYLLLLEVILLAGGCGADIGPVALHDAGAIPTRLSEWHLLVVDGGRLHPNRGVVPYDLNAPLFSDYALKLRTVWMPPGSKAVYRSDREFDFPTGTIISKTFHYRYAPDGSGEGISVIKADLEAALDDSGGLDLDVYFLAETRLLVRYEDGWQAFPYVWNAAQSEAFLEPAGALLNLDLVSETGDSNSINYVVPDSNQCAACHMPDHGAKELRPLGPKARQLNRDYAYTGGERNQLEFWSASGMLEGLDLAGLSAVPKVAAWFKPGDASPEERARAYLDANCAHCHNPEGAADTSALNLNIEAAVGRGLGICKPPVAVGRGSGNRPYDIYPGRAEDSILLYRMENTDPAIAMPELGRASNHIEGIRVIRDWINGLSGEC